MTDTLHVVFLYPGADPVGVLERVAEAFAAREWDHVDVRGPRERFGVTELDLSLRSEDAVLATSLEAFDPDRLDRHAIPDVPALELLVGADDLRTGATSDRVAELLDLVRGVYDATGPAYAYGLDPFQAEGVGDELPMPVTAEGLREPQVADVSWLMLLPPAFVEAYGRPRLVTAPTHSWEELDDGGLLLVAAADPTDPDGVDYADLRAHVGVKDPGPNV